MPLARFLAKELAPTHRRFIEAGRNAVKATLTTAAAAILQILGPFGPLFAFRIGQPGISLGLFEGGLIIVAAAAMQAAIVPITGKLLDYPGLIMAFLFAVFATIAYLLSNTRLFLILALVAVGTITTVYVGIFEPGQIGWGSTYTFDGILAATVVMVAVDTWIWPSPAEARLLESVAADLERSRKRLRMVCRHYLEPSAAPLPASQLASRLAPHLTLLRSIKERDKPAPHHLARLLDAVVTSERIFLEVERLAVFADEPGRAEIRLPHQEQLESALEIFDATFATRIEEILAGLPDDPVGRATDLRTTIQHLKELCARSLAASTTSMASGVSTFAGFVGVLEVIADLLMPPPFGSVAIEAATTEIPGEQNKLFDPDRFRFSVKLGATIVLGLLVGLTTQRADLQTILWSIAVAGQPNQYGAVLRKTFLRLMGCLMGGLATLGAMLIVSQHFDSLPPYLIAIFAVTWFSTYLAQSSDWLNYAGIQTGITFLICYVGLGPSTDVYRPLWRFWGIVLGILTTGFVFLVLWPEYATDKLIDGLDRLMKTTLSFGEEVAQKTITAGRMVGVDQRLSTNLLEVLNLADQAKLEGERGHMNSTNSIDAATTLIRIAYHFMAIARVRLSGSEADLPDDVLEHYTAWEKEYCVALESRIAKFESARSPGAESAMLTPSTIEIGYIASDQVGAALSHGEGLAAQLESYRRLAILLDTLDTALSKIAVEA